MTIPLYPTTLRKWLDVDESLFLNFAIIEDSAPEVAPIKCAVRESVVRRTFSRTGYSKRWRMSYFNDTLLKKFRSSGRFSNGTFLGATSEFSSTL